MKYLIFIFIILDAKISFAQNVGIGTTAPQAKLQINHNSVTAPGLTLVDSSLVGMGKQRFQNRSVSNRTIGFNGFLIENNAASTFLDVVTDSLTLATFRGNGSVGINNLSPTERLDIRGNMNISNGTIKANGVAGQAGQYLSTNNFGQLQWMDKSEFKKSIVIYAVPGVNPQPWGTWPVPPGVTKVMIELWGGGGGGTALAGGGGGGYVCVTLDVTEASNIIYLIGLGGAGSNFEATTGTGTNLILNSLLGFYANGGTGAVSNSASPTNAQVGFGGSWFSTTSLLGLHPTALNLIGQQGQSGRAKTISLSQKTATEFIEFQANGDGGDAGNTLNTGSLGLSMSINSVSGIKSHTDYGEGRIPGGGGGSGYRPIHITSAIEQAGRKGADGMIIIHY